MSLSISRRENLDRNIEMLMEVTKSLQRKREQEEEERNKLKEIMEDVMTLLAVCQGIRILQVQLANESTWKNIKEYKETADKNWNEFNLVHERVYKTIKSLLWRDHELSSS